MSFLLRQATQKRLKDLKNWLMSHLGVLYELQMSQGSAYTTFQCQCPPHPGWSPPLGAHNSESWTWSRLKVSMSLGHKIFCLVSLNVIFLGHIVCQGQVQDFETLFKKKSGSGAWAPTQSDALSLQKNGARIGVPPTSAPVSDTCGNWFVLLWSGNQNWACFV